MTVTSIRNNPNICSSAASAVCSKAHCFGLLFKYAGKLTSLPLHGTERAHNFDQAFITKPNYPQSTILMLEKALVCCAWRHESVFVTVCHAT